MAGLNSENCGRICDSNTALFLLATRVLPASSNFGQAKHGQKGPTPTFCPKGVCSPMYNQHFTFYAPSQYLSFRVAGRRAKNFNFSQTFNSPQHLRPCHIQYVRCVSQGGWEEKSPSCGIVCPYSPQQLVISDTPISKLDQTTNNWSSSILIVWLKCEFYAKVYFVCQAVSKFFVLGGKQYKSTFTRYTACLSVHFFHFEKWILLTKFDGGYTKRFCWSPHFLGRSQQKHPI